MKEKKLQELPPCVNVGTTVLKLVKDGYYPDTYTNPIQVVGKHYSMDTWTAIAVVSGYRVEGQANTPQAAADALYERLVVLACSFNALVEL